MHHHFSCRADPLSPKRVRQEVTSALAGIPPDELATIELLVSELATNVVLHGGSEMAVDVRIGYGRVRVEISDDSEAMPTPREPGADEDHGRGLKLVERAAAAWGVQPQHPGKTVWFEVPL